MPRNVSTIVVDLFKDKLTLKNQGSLNNTIKIYGYKAGNGSVIGMLGEVIQYPILIWYSRSVTNMYT